MTRTRRALAAQRRFDYRAELIALARAGRRRLRAIRATAIRCR